MTWIALLFALELGTVSNQAWVLYDEYVAPEPTIYTTLEADVMLFDTVFVGGVVRTDAGMKEFNNFDPFWTTYTFHTGLRFDNVEVGFRHLCTHPIQTYADPFNIRTPVIEGGYEEFYIRFSGGL